ncbi:MAG: PLP-dependent aminotransferase family protein [Proteobacteria bacterium]|jgi:2-aminoadipate transaminase|nr:PLP-dependent aminotransferase family protein [Pseudomonadota bacterium]MDA1299482.1 PLP-dependent aminotransferase family protein [Pseudomonadota bacterium]
MSEIRYDFGGGRSDPGTFPAEALKAAAIKVFDEQWRQMNDYPGGLGHAGMRAAMAQRESDRESVAVDPDHLILTNGSMQGVTLTAEALQDNPGDTVIVEEFSYPGTLGAYRSLKYDMVGIRLDEGGMRMDHLASELERLEAEGRRPRFIYPISTYQNPTGFVMPRDRRLEMIELARRYDIPIVEDNCYADVHYEGPVEPAIYALDDDPRHIYLCSLSKILAPGLRLGYILARPPMLGKILARRHDAGSNFLAAAIVAEFYRDGIWSHAGVANAALKTKRDLTTAGLKQELEDVCVWSNPVGGLFIWVRLPDDVDRSKLRTLTLERGFNYLVGSSFHYRGKDVPYIRLAFGHLTHEQISEGIPVLARCIREARTSNEPRGFDSLFM